MEWHAKTVQSMILVIHVHIDSLYVARIQW